MKFKSCIKDKATFKCDSLENTIARLTKALESLGLVIDYSSYKFSRTLNLYWGILKVSSLNFSSNGKGVSLEIAKASAFAEMVERISSGSFFKRDSTVKNLGSDILSLKFLAASNYDYLEGYVYSHQDALTTPLTIDEILVNKPEFDKVVIDRFKQHELCKHWVDGYSLIREKKIKVPLKFIKKISGTNGLASGNTIEEAIVQASNEIFERYVCIDTLQNKKIIPTIAVESIENKNIRKIIRLLQKNKIALLIKDFSENKLFPCIGTLMINDRVKNSKNPLKKAFQYRTFRVGASFTTDEALLRCFTEGMQGKMLKNLSKKSKYDFLWDNFLSYFEPNYEPEISYLNIFKRYEFGGDLSFLEKGPLINYNLDEPVYDCLEELEKIKAICRRLGTDFIVINHTHPILDFPVVRVIIPGISDLLSSFDLREGSSPIKELHDLDKITDVFIANNDRYFHQSDWMNNENALRRLTREIIQSVQRTNTFMLDTVGLLNRNIDAAKLLASIYYKLGDLKQFAICAKLLSHLYPKQRFQYTYLYLSAKFNQKEHLEEKLKTMKGCDFYFLSEPLRNPFISWCDKPCSENCEAKYLRDLEKLIDSFYVTTKEKAFPEKKA